MKKRYSSLFFLIILFSLSMGYSLLSISLSTSTKVTISLSKITLFFDANGGTMVDTNKEIIFNQSVGELPVPKRVNYVFKGWYLDDEEVKSSTILNTKENATLVAKWEIIPSKIIGDGTTIGDEICFDTECFNVVEVGEKTIKLLAKYNLSVGNIVQQNGTILQLTNSSGKQSEQMKGFTKDETGDIFPRNGTLAFSRSSYWSAGEVDLNSASNTIYPHLIAYQNILQSEYGIDVKIDLITKEVLSNLGCETKSAPTWIYNTSFWTKTAASSSNIWYLDTSKSFTNYTYTSYIHNGVRPLIEIPKELLK